MSFMTSDWLMKMFKYPCTEWLDRNAATRMVSQQTHRHRSLTIRILIRCSLLFTFAVRYIHGYPFCLRVEFWRSVRIVRFFGFWFGFVCSFVRVCSLWLCVCSDASGINTDSLYIPHCMCTRVGDIFQRTRVVDILSTLPPSPLPSSICCR